MESSRNLQVKWVKQSATVDLFVYTFTNIYIAIKEAILVNKNYGKRLYHPNIPF